MSLKKRTKKDKPRSLIDFDQPSNTEEFIEELRVMSAAAVGVVLVRTKELQRAAATLFEFTVAKSDTKFRVWSITEGWKELPTAARSSLASPTGRALGMEEFGGTSPETGRENAQEESQEYIFDLYAKGIEPQANTIEIGRALSWLINTISEQEDREHSVNVMFAPEHWFAAPNFEEYIRTFVTKSFDIDARLVLICHDTVTIPERLFEELRVMDFLPPNAGELYNFCSETVEGLDLGDVENEITLSSPDKERLVQNALGMSYNEFTTALSIGLVRQDEALKDGDPVDIDKLVETILETKVEIIKKNNILEMMKPIDIDKVGGMDLLKDWLNERKIAFTSDAREYGIDMPKGILCAGPPGTGKSLVAKAIAAVLGLPLISFDIGKVFGGLVGQSEGQMRSSLNLIEAMAPVVLLMDEIDKGFSNVSGGGDSGTSARVFGTFLTWMQERKSQDKPVFVVMTANNVSHLPPELLRKGRLDEIFFVGFPSAEERKQILKIHLGLRGHEDVPDEDVEMVLEHTNKFVGAELEAIVKDSLLRSMNEGLPHPTGAIMTKFAKETRPLSKTFGDKIRAMAEWAEKNAQPASSLSDDGTKGIASVGTSNSRPMVKRHAKRIIKPSRQSSDD